MGFRIGGYILLFFVTSVTCEHQENSAEYVPVDGFDDPKVIVVVMDGARYSETCGDETHQWIPRIANDMKPYGVTYTRFYNQGPTYTTAGHIAITTGFYQEVNNSGEELPDHHSMFQQWIRDSGKEKVKAWIIASKDKLEVLANCNDSLWKDSYTPKTNCGRFGLGVGSGYRDDASTWNMVMKVLNTYKPELMVINFKQPDEKGHSGNYVSYLESIRMIDALIYYIWHYTQTNEWYKDKTTFFMTNDHGRHSNSISNGFVSHGDGCDGCRHVMLYVSGPGIRMNVEIDSVRELIDIPVTIGEILGFELSHSEGHVMGELFDSFVTR